MSSVTGILSTDDEVIKREELATLLYSSNILQDHRGQAGGGTVVANTKRIKDPIKDRGPARISTPLNELRRMSDHTVFAGLAHTCYSKNRFLTRENIHPLEVDSKKHDMYVVSDGVLLDKEKRREKLRGDGYTFDSNTNGSVIGTLFAKYLDETGNEFEAGKMLIDDTFGCGGFSAIMMVRGKGKKETKLVAIKDKRAINPMCYGERDGTFFVTSETYPLQNFGVENIKRAKGGDVIVFSENGIEPENFGDTELEMPCLFKIIYFGGPEDLVLEGLGPRFEEFAKRLGRDVKPSYRPSNYTVRNCLGLAWYDYWKDDVPEPDIISPIVDSGNGVTAGIAAGYDISAKKYLQTLAKTLAYRTYLMSDEKERWLENLLKLKVITDLPEGKIIIIGDDSIVKGGVGGLSVYGDEFESSFFPKKNYGIVGQMMNIGKVKELIMAISYSPMFFQCFSDFANMEKYVAQDFIDRPFIEICDRVTKRLESGQENKGKLRVRYNTLEDVYDICGRGYCAACADGNYPVDEGFIPDKIKERREKLTLV